MQTISYVHIQQFQATFMSVFFWEAPFLVFTNCLQLIKARLCEPMSHYLCYCIFIWCRAGSVQLLLSRRQPLRLENEAKGLVFEAGFKSESRSPETHMSEYPNSPQKSTCFTLEQKLVLVSIANFSVRDKCSVFLFIYLIALMISGYQPREP